jgi:non-specific protein-tyrosine kinase
LLGSQHLRDLIDKLLTAVDVVVVDAPPLLPVTDAAVLARVCDGAILVIRHGRIRQDQVTRALDSLAAVDARVLGTVLNDAPAKGADAYTYGYGGGIYESRSDRPRLDALASPTVTPQAANTH